MTKIEGEYIGREIDPFFEELVVTYSPTGGKIVDFNTTRHVWLRLQEYDIDFQPWVYAEQWDQDEYDMFF